ncbi:MAG: rhodanese-like domain-containing protein [Alphaproteobacteria bacterium]|nr:rhodanese-like domain-containing protein [Alphaproteobacteria bacterium]
MNHLSAYNLKEHLAKGHVCLIDVRTPAEYAAEHIDGALNIPLKDIEKHTLPVEKGEIVLYCRSGMRSQQALEKLSLLDDGDTKIYHLQGGLLAWKQAGFKTMKSKKFHLPIERQVFIIAGILIMLGMVLGTYYDTLFYALPTFVGLGLTFAGLTGWCGMALLLTKMPWNK